jgi:hypothetical protein
MGTFFSQEQEVDENPGNYFELSTLQLLKLDVINLFAGPEETCARVLRPRTSVQKTPAKTPRRKKQAKVKARKEAQHALRRAKDEFMWKLGTGPQGSKFFWSYIKERSKVPMNNTAFTEEGKSITQPQEVASLFSQSFQKNFSQAVGIFPFMRRNTPATTPEMQPACLNEIKISAGEAKNLLESIKQNSATGPDKIPAIVLKKCSSVELLIPISQTFVPPGFWGINVSCLGVKKGGGKKSERSGAFFFAENPQNPAQKVQEPIF